MVTMVTHFLTTLYVSHCEISHVVRIIVTIVTIVTNPFFCFLKEGYMFYPMWVRFTRHFLPVFVFSPFTNFSPPSSLFSNFLKKYHIFSAFISPFFPKIWVKKAEKRVFLSKKSF